MPTLQSLNAKIEKLKKQAEVLALRERSGAVRRVLDLMTRLGVKVADLPSGKAQERKAATKTTLGKAKYRDPSSGKTWTGHGRAPDWIKNVSNRDSLLIGTAKGSDAAPATGKARTAKKSRATKPTVGKAKYRDPATGKTWTGHGRAPDWIKNATNREAFVSVLQNTSMQRRPTARRVRQEVPSGKAGQASTRKHARGKVIGGPSAA